MKKKILIVATVYRVGERVYPLIPKMHKFADLDLLQVDEMSNDMQNYGNIDYREQFHKKYDKYFDNIIDGTSSSIQSQGATNKNPSNVILNLDVKKYDMIFYESRHSTSNPSSANGADLHSPHLRTKLCEPASSMTMR